MLPPVILNQLYKHTQLQNTFGVIMLALVNNRPEILNLKQILVAFLEHRREVVIRRTAYELRKAEERAHIVEGLNVALAHLDEVIALIRGGSVARRSQDRPHATLSAVGDSGASHPGHAAPAVDATRTTETL